MWWRGMKWSFRVGRWGEKGTWRPEVRMTQSLLKNSKHSNWNAQREREILSSKWRLEPGHFVLKTPHHSHLYTLFIFRVPCLLKPKRPPYILQPSLWLESERLLIYAPCWSVSVFFLQYPPSISVPYTGVGVQGGNNCNSKGFQNYDRYKRSPNPTHSLTVEKTEACRTGKFNCSLS